MMFSNQQLLVIGLVILAVLWYLKSQAGELAKTKLNPTSDENLAYTGVNSVGQALSGDEHWTFGTWLYEITHPSEEG